MTTILTILFLIPFWMFLKFWSKFLHEFDLVLDSVSDKTIEIYSDRSFCMKTWAEWHSQIKLMKIQNDSYYFFNCNTNFCCNDNAF